VRPLLVILLLLSGSGVIASLFAPKVRTVEVVGNRHLGDARVRELADVHEGDPFLWVTRRRVRDLANDPWVLRLEVVRQWPDVIRIALVERSPALTDGRTTWADDGTVLPDAGPSATAGLPRLEGWGTPRTTEALELLMLLRPFGPEVIQYSPEGFEILLTGTTLITSSADALRKQWSAFVSNRGGRIAVYPWGVSKAHD
jgi:hypothetical protein